MKPDPIKLRDVLDAIYLAFVVATWLPLIVANRRRRGHGGRR